MQVTSAQANKMLKKLNSDYEYLVTRERENSSFLCAMGEDLESIRPEYDFASVQKELSDLEVSIQNLKHAINCFNSQTLVGDSGLTIDQVLIRIPILTKKIYRLRSMSMQQPKQRVEARQSGTGIIADYRYANYDPEEAKAAYDAACEELAALQTALDLVNSTVEFSVTL